MSFLNKILIMVAVVCCFSGAADVLTPVDSSTLFLRPDTSGITVFALDKDQDIAEINYNVVDYTGNCISTRRGAVVDRRLTVELKLPQGYYELQFDDLKQTFGVVVLNDYSAPENGFWQLDAGLSWSRWDFSLKQRYVKQLLGKGISGFRERLAWPAIDTKNGMEPNQNAYQSVRNDVYGEHRVLELFEDSPYHLRYFTKNPFAIDLGKTYRSWQQIGDCYRPSWSALEIWNEPFYAGKGLPADQYVPVVKAVSAANPAVRMAGGSFSPSVAAVYLDNCAENRFLDVIDVLSLHFYGKPQTMGTLIPFYRNWLIQNRHGNMPIWVSESGTPMQLGKNNRPSPEIDADSARDSVMRAVECRALGVERFYIFYLQHWLQGAIYWGMTDRNATPQRTLAAWLYAAQTIRNLPYIGRLKAPAAEIALNRIFADGDQAIAVCYSKYHAVLSIPFADCELFGADGRKLTASSGNTVVSDGILYIKVAKNLLAGKIDTDTEFFEYGKMPVEPRRLCKLILQPRYIPEQYAYVTNSGYFIKKESEPAFRAAVNVVNISDQPVMATVSCNLPGAEPKQQLLQPLETKTVEWVADIGGLLRQPPLKIIYSAKSPVGDDQAVSLLYPEPAKRIYPVFHSRAGIELDGKMSDPSWGKALLIDSLKCLNDNPDGAALTNDDFKATARYLWNDTGLYFYVEVNDRQHEAPQSAALSWQRDSLQIAFSQQNSIHDNNQFEWGFYLDQEGPHKTLFYSSLKKPLSDETRIAIVRDEAAQKTVYEGVISWYDLGSMDAINERAGSRFRLSFIVNDANNGNRRWLEWSPGIAKGKNPAEYPELVLCGKDEKEVAANPPAVADLLKGWQIAEPGCVSQVKYAGKDAIKMIDQKKNAITRDLRLPAPSEKPLIISFLLAATEFSARGNTGFSFKIGFYDRDKNEGYECWIAPDRLFSGRSGFAIGNSDGTLVQLGEAGSVFPTDGKFYKMIFFYDPAGCRLKLLMEKDGKNILLAEGQGKKILKQINQIRIQCSGWGAGPLILSEFQAE